MALNKKNILSSIVSTFSTSKRAGNRPSFFQLRSFGFLLFFLPAILILPVDIHAKSANEVFEQASKCVVVIYNLDETGHRQKFASGVVISNGEVATNHHVLQQAAKLAVVYFGKAFTAKPKYCDPERDVSILEVPGLKAPKAVIGEKSQLKVGTKVYAIGSPRGLELTLSDGIVSGFREVKGGHYIQTTTPISSGSSGGGLFDDEGRLVGLPTFFLTEGQQLNFAVPIEWVLELESRQNADTTNEQNRAEWLKKVNVLKQKKDWLGMQQVCQQWIKAQPKSGEAWHYSGLAYSRIGNAHKAISAIQKSLRLNPGNSTAWSDLGVAYGLANLRIDAIDAYKKAIDANLDNDDAWVGLGMAYSANSQTDKTVAAFKQALLINPDNAQALFYLGQHYANENNREKVMELYRKLKIIAPLLSKRFLENYILPQ
jgi:Tfp pilus assembly protein PilF